MDQTEKHFQMMIYLMLTFFCVYIGLSMLQGLKVLAAPEAIASSYSSFQILLGIAVGMFHGMIPQGSVLDQSNTKVSSTVTTDIHSEKDVPAAVVTKTGKLAS